MEVKTFQASFPCLCRGEDAGQLPCRAGPQQLPPSLWVCSLWTDSSMRSEGWWSRMSPFSFLLCLPLPPQASASTPQLACPAKKFRPPTLSEGDSQV